MHSGNFKNIQKYVFKTENRLMQIKCIAKCSEHLAIKLRVFNALVCLFEWPLKIGFTVYVYRAFDINARVLLNLLNELLDRHCIIFSQ